MTNKYAFIERTFGGGGGQLFDFEVPKNLFSLKDAKEFSAKYLKRYPKIAYIAILDSKTADELAWVGNAGSKEEYLKNNHKYLK